jgi:general secretion pathway protein J
MKALRGSPRPSPQRHRAEGFTLVEVLVALFLMSLLAALSWQGLDSVLRSRDASRVAVDDAVRLATVLTQWEQDLLALHDSAAVPALDFDGQTLRLTRRTESGVALVAWAVRGGVWQRWMSPPYTRTNELQEVWLRNQQFLGNEAGQVELARGASDWQIYFYRGNAWTNAQSTGDLQGAGAALPNAGVASAVAASPSASSASAAADGAAAVVAGAASAPARAAAPVEQLPAAVRLVISLDGKKLTRDIALGPTGS